MKVERLPRRTLRTWIPVFEKAAKSGNRLLPWASLCRETGLSRGSLRKTMQRFEKQGMVHRVGPGLYASSLFPPSLEEIAMAVGKPCYVSFESALSRYGILSQSPMTLACATRRKPALLQTFVGEVCLRHLAGQRFWGFKEERGILWAEPEKALLDWLYWRLQTQGQAPALDELATEDLDKTKLSAWSLKYPKTVQRALSFMSGLPGPVF